MSCARRPRGAAPRCCDRARTRRESQLPDHDRPGCADRRRGHPGVLRHRLPVRSGLPLVVRPPLPLDSPLTMAAFAVFGISNSGVNTAVNLLIVFLVVIWLALVYWTYADARRRIADPMLIGCATVASFFPFVGTIIYMIVRPPEYLDDVRERELEMQAAEARLAQLGYQLCPHCDYEVEKDFLRCPSCMRKLKDPCIACGRPLDPSWKICPFCEAEVNVASTAPRRARRRREEPQPAAGAADQPFPG
ncbi:MAG TPA: zinc ribbon domain-containing protein [Solirubrobacteraceae bacterium]